MRKFEVLFRTLADLRSLTRGQSGKQIKRLIGDSVKNNRTVTVNQVVRYLSKVGVTHLAESVSAATEILENEILQRRQNRTDAIDLSELVNTYRQVVMNGRNNEYRRRIGNALSKVG